MIKNYVVFLGLSIKKSYSKVFSFLWIAVAVGGLQLISPITKFCPVYFILNKLMSNTDPIQNGKQNLSHK